MAGGTVRFIQSSDWQLHKPVIAAAHCADRAIRLLADAPRRAAQNVFDAAIQHRVDFLLLAGNIGDPRRIGAAGFQFLVEQCARLEAEGILVYWSLGDSDRQRRWPAAVGWPGNVHQFDNPSPTVTTFQRSGVPLVDIIGASWTANRNVAIEQFEMDPSCDQSIVLGGNIQDGHKDLPGVKYWALGGRDELATLELPEGIVHFAGSPQARQLTTGGPHGSTLVEMNGQGRPRIEPLDCDAVRFIQQPVGCEGIHPADITEAIRQSAAELVRNCQATNIIVQWTCPPATPVTHSHPLRSDSQRWLTDVASMVQRDHGQILGSSFRFDFPPQHGAIHEESLRASYLDTLAEMADQGRVMPVLAEAAAGLLPSELGALLSRSDSDADQELVRQAAELGGELLGPNNQGDCPPTDREAA